MMRIALIDSCTFTYVGLKNLFSLIRTTAGITFNQISAEAALDKNAEIFDIYVIEPGEINFEFNIDKYIYNLKSIIQQESKVIIFSDNIIVNSKLADFCLCKGNSFSKVFFFFDSLLKKEYESIRPFLEDYLLSKNEAILLRCLSKNQRMKSVEKITSIPISNLYYYKYSAMRKLGLKSTKELFRYLNRVLNHSV
ncbi:hypothetical protein QNM34_00800 [Rahnella bonaserana]|uniref:hypothetical protein n=1 Tax=Rahnella bonaserana TaxID=2816248 RepID=UPI0024C2D230|nr:hypothetical protein [Rahnella bonaserana]MCL9644362.1 hypothetical protein [Rahnella victoriana]WHZ40885.1 hypothetical protein QNM34_00800 [Rahnella bonaserana]